MTDSCPTCDRLWPDSLMAGYMDGCLGCIRECKRRMDAFEVRYKKALRKVQTSGKKGTG